MVQLDLSSIHSYSLFPGQVLAVEGTNPIGEILFAQRIFTEAYAPPAPAPKLSQSTDFVIAAGPFTRPTDLAFEPLWDLMEIVRDNEPHVLLLIGPFLPDNHKLVRVENFHATFQAIFEKQIAKVMSYVQG